MQNGFFFGLTIDAGTFCIVPLDPGFSKLFWYQFCHNSTFTIIGKDKIENLFSIGQKVELVSGA